MSVAVYNSAIPDVILNTVNCALRLAVRRGVGSIFAFLFLALAMAHAVDWSAPEQQLAHKIVAVTGPGPVALTVDNRSSLTKRENEIVQNGLRVALEGLGEAGASCGDRYDFAVGECHGVRLGGGDSTRCGRSRSSDGLDPAARGLDRRA
jgi:hypothetical protein